MDLRDIPSVHHILSRLGDRTAAFPHDLVVTEIRHRLDLLRAGHVTSTQLDDAILAGLESLRQRTLQRVINATGVILHTNLGRAPLGPAAVEPGYTNLEYDLATGKRGKRDAHVSPLLERLLGVPAIAVNNGAAAVFLALNELAAGAEAIVSRGELIEIGDGFRIPEIMARSGVILREVGTTNRTSLDDYRNAITDRTRVLLRVHRSNFRISGFTSQPSPGDLVQLGRERGIPVYEDLGSGCLVDLSANGIQEPLVSTSLEAGMDLVSFSGDKLLGGPQAGILAGKAELVARVRRNPLYRVLRLDKTSVQILAGTLRRLVLRDYDAIPSLRMIRQSSEAIERRARQFVEAIPGLRASIEPGESVIGGGATPEQSLATFLIRIESADAIANERALRAWCPPVIARIDHGEIVLDLRTVFEEDIGDLTGAVASLIQKE